MGKYLIEPPAFALIALSFVDAVTFEVDIVNENIGTFGIDPAVFFVEEPSVIFCHYVTLPFGPGVFQYTGKRTVQTMQHKSCL